MSDSVPVCIDISHHQGYPDFDEVARAGVLGVIHKATEGTSFVDQARAENCSNAIASGLAVATYHWLSPGSSPTAQMEFYLSVVDPAEGERVIIDYEEDGCTLPMLKDAVQALLDYGHGLQISVYSGHLLKEQLNGDCDDFLAANTDLWLAQYTSGTPSWSEGTYPQWTLWQYSETGEISGIDDSYVDLNHFNGDNEAFLQWISPAGSKPPKPEPPPSTELVNVAVSAPDTVDVRVSVNGTNYQRGRRIRRPVKRGPDLFWRRP
jgi:lysozyme